MIILYLLNILSKEELKNSEIMRLCLSGVQNRLSSSIPFIRKMATIIAEKFSKIIDLGNTLVIDEEYKGQLEEYENIIYQKNIKFETKIEKEEIKEIKKEEIKNIEENDPDELLFGGNISHSESESDTDSFEPLDLEETVKEPVKRPKYVKEIIELLSASTEDSEQVEKLEAALKYGKDVVDKKPNDLNEFSSTICKRILYSIEGYNIENFEKMKHELLVSLIVNSTEFSVK